MKTLILMQGIPGSGKSTVARSIQRSMKQAVILSTDDFWYDQNGKYNFDPDLLGMAHRTTQVKAEGEMRKGTETIIIDNTNIKREHVQPYLDLAISHDYVVQVVRVSVDPGVACARQLSRPEDRRVPVSIIMQKHLEMENLI